MRTSILFPTDKEGLEKALDSAVAAADAVKNVRAVEWLTNYYYLQGVRNIPAVNYRDGTVEIRYSSVRGKQGFRFHEAMTRVSRELGRMIRMDVSPLVRPLGMTLDGLRRSSISQVVLSSLFSSSYLEEVKLQFLKSLLIFGTVGLGGWPVHTEEETRYILEIIPPWELLPVPADAVSDGEVHGIIRTRWVALEWVKKMLNADIREPRKRLPLDKMEIINVAYGSALKEHGSPSTTTGPGNILISEEPKKLESASKDSGTKSSSYTKRQQYVRFVELWLYDNFRMVNRYVMSVGKQIVRDNTLEGNESYPLPIGISRYYDPGGFYGLSFASPLIPINSEVEAMLSNLFKNVRDLDIFGFTLFPTTWGLNTQSFKAGQRPRALFYQPDYSVPTLQPHTIQPANTGTLPGQVAKLGMDVLNQLSGQSEMLTGDAPGRVDSATGLGYLSEMSSIPLGGPSVSTATAFSNVYGAILFDAKRNMDGAQITSYTFLDDSLAGIALNRDGSISLDVNALPDPRDVEITIRSQYPRSVNEKKQELLLLLEKQIITPEEFRTQSRILNLDLPVANDAEWAAYRQAVLNNITLFNDGESPGEITMTEYEIHPIHLERMIAFMGKPEFQLASPEVRKAFVDALEQRRSLMGRGSYPNQLPNPEDLEEYQKMMQRRIMELQTGGASQGPEALLAMGPPGTPGQAPPS